MIYRILFLLFLASSLGLNAQLDCKETFTMKVTAKSGLNMRELANSASPVLTTIPYDNILIACTSTSGKLVVGNTSGFWRQVSFEGKLGYVFDAYLELVDPALRKAMAEQTKIVPAVKPKDVIKKEEKKEPVRVVTEEKTPPPPPPPLLADPDSKPSETKTEVPVIPTEVIEPVQDYSFLLEAYNFCGAVEDIDPGILWYGFYPANQDQGETDMKVQPVELEIVLSKSRSSKGLEFDIRTDREERSLFLIGSTRPLDIASMDLEDRSTLMRYSNQKVFPGQQINIGTAETAASISATGGISSTGDCPELDNYKLMVTTNESLDIMSLLPKGQCGLPEIYWFGDLNGDQLPDFIVVSIFEDRNVFTLLVSQNDPMMRKAAQWTNAKCKS